METVLEKIEVKDDEKLVRQGGDLVQIANSLAVTNDVDCAKAKDICDTLKAFLDGPGSYHDKSIEMAHNLHKLLCGKRNAIVDPVKSAWKGLKDRMAVYIDNQRRNHEEEVRRAEAEARRIEEEKQAKIQAKIDEENRKIEAIRQEEERKRRIQEEEIKKIKDDEKREQMRKEEAERRAAEEARIEQERIKAASKTEKLEAKKEAVYVAPKVVQAASIPAGASVQYTYEVEITNKSLVPDLYKIVDVAGLVRDQKSRKGQLVVPGVRFTRKPIGSTRATKVE